MRLHTLGSLHLVGHSFQRPKPLLLLAYLALEGPKARRYVAELFFMDAKDPLNSLSRSVSYLREESPELIEGDHQQIATRVSCDAAELLELANMQAFERCRELYQGAFAEYVNFALSEELEDWLYKTREHLAKRMRDVLLHLAEGRIAQGQLVDAAGDAERAYTLTAAPELEPDEFVRLHQLLRVTNSPRVVELRREAQEYGIVLETSTLSTVPDALPEPDTIPNNLPLLKSSFVGRSQELATLAAHLSQPECRLLTLHGMGGIGKSRLALRYAHEALKAKTFPDGIFFVELDKLQNANDIPATVAAALGLKIQDPTKALEVVTEFVGRQHLLLVFDNFETVIAGATLASKLLEVCPGLKLLVTSRERLNLEDEWVLSVEGLPLTLKRDDGLTKAEPSDAELLFMLRAKRAKLDFTLSPEVASSVRDICHLVEGSPLGIELAASWVKSLPVADISSELQRNLDLLSSTLRDTPERHASIRAVFEQSWQHLSAKEHSVLQKLSVFVDGFSREAASAVTGATIPVLSSLQEKSWLRVTDKGRYTRHPLVYQFTKEKFSDEEVRNEVCEKHQSYYGHFLSRRYNEPDKFSEIDGDIENILHGVETAYARGNDDYALNAVRHLMVGDSYFVARGHTERSLALLSKAAEMAKTKGDWEKAHYFVARLGDVYREAMGNFDTALEAFEEARTLAQRWGNQGREAHMLSLIGITLAQQGSDEAELYLERAYRIAEQAEDDFTRGRILEHQGYIAGLKEDWGPAADKYQAAYDLVQGLKMKMTDDKRKLDTQLFFIQLNRGNIEKGQGNITQALFLTENALTIAKNLDNKVWQAYALENLGYIYHASGQKQRAGPYYLQALALYQETHVTVEVAELQSFLVQEGYVAEEGMP